MPIGRPVHSGRDDGKAAFGRLFFGPFESMRDAMWISRLLLGGVLLGLHACTATPPVAPEQRGGPWQGWQDFRLPGKAPTVYRVHDEGGQWIVDARADASASMLRRALRIDATQVTGVRFSWRVERLIASADLSEADAADSPARLVFAFDGDQGKLSLRNRMLFDLAQALTGEAPPYATLMYVWDNRAVPESVISGPRTDRVRKIVLESGAANLGRWLHYERDLRADYRRAFGEEPGALLGVALMTDADNTASRARAEYGEVRLVGADGRAF